MVSRDRSKFASSRGLSGIFFGISLFIHRMGKECKDRIFSDQYCHLVCHFIRTSFPWSRLTNPAGSMYWCCLHIVPKKPPRDEVCHFNSVGSLRSSHHRGHRNMDFCSLPGHFRIDVTFLASRMVISQASFSNVIGWVFKNPGSLIVYK